MTVNQQKPEFSANIPNQTSTYVGRTHQPAVVRSALIGQSQKYGWLRKRREEESFRNDWNGFSLQEFHRETPLSDIKASFWISQDQHGSTRAFIPSSPPGSCWGLIPAITGREARSSRDTHTHTVRTRFQFSVERMCVFLDYGRKREPTHTARPELEPRTF